MAPKYECARAEADRAHAVRPWPEVRWLWDLRVRSTHGGASTAREHPRRCCPPRAARPRVGGVQRCPVAEAEAGRSGRHARAVARLDCGPVVTKASLPTAIPTGNLGLLDCCVTPGAHRDHAGHGGDMEPQPASTSELPASFDVVQLGTGRGHTASWPPGDDVVESKRRCDSPSTTDVADDVDASSRQRTRFVWS